MFRKKRLTGLSLARTDYPIGSFIQTEKGFFYIKSNSNRLRIVSKRLLDSWSPQRVVQTTESAVRHYKITAKMMFRNGSLIWNVSDAKIYLIENGKRRWLKSPDWYPRLGIEDTRSVQAVSQSEIELHEEGDPLD